MRSPVIKVDDLWFSYNGNPVLKDVNLKIYPRDFLAVIGPNGGGKTTLIKLMLGLLAPDRGTVRVFGHSPREAAVNIGYVPQDIGINKSFPISVRDVVLMGRMRGGGGWRRFSRSDKIAARQALERVEMWKYRKRRIGELSGGQRQRVFMARALVGDPKILLLDEPTASVDQKGQTDFYALLKQLNEEITVVVVSHDLMVLSSYIKSVACVSQQVFFHDAPEITRDMLEMAYHCPVELIAHGVPHRVLPKHSGESDAGSTSV
jgi:zinc transport system ATP-binding protein